MDHLKHQSSEAFRLVEEAQRFRNWKRWGPYLSERQWSTVREDYSEWGTCWEYFPHDHARSRAYRWGEDGLLGWTDRQCRLCFALALWNGQDPILKERLFGLTGNEGNHGEDVKEEYFYLESTPTHSYAKALYKYPQGEYPYAQLVDENRKRDRLDSEHELVDTGLFRQNRYFDVFAEYAKADTEDTCIRITIANRGPRAAALYLLPSLWFRNTWSWGAVPGAVSTKPRLELSKEGTVEATHESLGRMILHYSLGADNRKPMFLFTENETNPHLHPQFPSDGRYFKDAFHEYLVFGRKDAVNPDHFGTKAAACYQFFLCPGESREIRLRLHPAGLSLPSPLGKDWEETFRLRKEETDEFYRLSWPGNIGPEEQKILRQAYAGLCWNKQFYNYFVQEWLEGDPAMPDVPEGRKQGRNSEWRHLAVQNVLSMPDKWEYPWFAAWDLAFHMIPFASIDPYFAKEQLLLLLREWYMHPNGQIPAYEFKFSDVNPPVHAWAAWRVYKIAARQGHRDREFLERVFQKLLLNFTWWVNRKDEEGKNLFSGGFLGLDNIGVFDRSKPLPAGGTLQQADGTAWMAFYCATMLSIALELAQGPDGICVAYEDMASKFLEHFVQIADAMNSLGGTGLWNEEDGFYYDEIQFDHHVEELKSRSLVGLLPLIAVEILEERVIQKLPGFRKRMDWFLQNRSDLSRHITYCESGHGDRLLAIPSRERLERVLQYMLDEEEFLSPYGIRSLSKYHEEQPFAFEMEGQTHQVDYVPGESNTWMFGGNSNWRGPIWFPTNYIILEALERYHRFYGDDLVVECPSGSGRKMNLKQVANEISRRLTRLFYPGSQGHRPSHGSDTRYAHDLHYKDLVLFYEYFHAETGRGCGASHQTGWTALVTRLIQDQAQTNR